MIATAHPNPAHLGSSCSIWTRTRPSKSKADEMTRAQLLTAHIYAMINKCVPEKDAAARPGWLFLASGKESNYYPLTPLLNVPNNLGG